MKHARVVADLEQPHLLPEVRGVRALGEGAEAQRGAVRAPLQVVVLLVDLHHLSTPANAIFFTDSILAQFREMASPFFVRLRHPFV